MTRLGTLIRNAREAKGWTLRELASRCRASIPYVSDIERGVRTGGPTRPVLAHALDIDPATLELAAAMDREPLLAKRIEELEARAASGHGLPAGRDCYGRSVCVGDTLDFDEREFGGPCRFVVEWEPAGPGGGPSDWSNWCTLVATYDGAPVDSRQET